MVRIIVKSGYMKGKSHKEYYVNYIATREGVEKFKSDYGNMKATKKQQKLIQQLIMISKKIQQEKMPVNLYRV